MATNKLQWKRIAMGDKLPCQSFLRKKDGEILKLSTVGGVEVGQDYYYLPVDEVINVIKNYPIEENEDDRIINNIRKVIGWYRGMFTEKNLMPEQYQEIDAWLEKKGEPTDIPADAVLDSNKDGLIVDTIRLKPKFKVGDWIIDVQGVSTSQIIGYEDDSYLIKTSCSQFYLPIKLTEKNYRLWTIQDAKDGDVICCKNGWTCIFKALDNHTNTFSSYCFMDSDKWFCNTGSECHTLDKAFIKAYNGEIYPATKEQRDLLFQKMKESGCEWDAEKKELKQGEQKQKDAEAINENALLYSARLEGIEIGKAEMKQQMMTKAVDIEVKVDAGGYPYIPQVELYDYDKDIPLAKEGDKYKVILIKEG